MELSKLCLQSEGLRHFPTRPVPDREPQFLLTQRQPDPLPWPLMSTVFLNDLRVLEFPDSKNFHVNSLIPWQNVSCTPFLAVGSVARTLLGTSGHKTKQEPCEKISLQGYYRSVAFRGV